MGWNEELILTSWSIGLSWRTTLGLKWKVCRKKRNVECDYEPGLVLTSCFLNDCSSHLGNTEQCVYAHLQVGYLTWGSLPPSHPRGRDTIPIWQTRKQVIQKRQVMSSKSQSKTPCPYQPYLKQKHTFLVQMTTIVNGKLSISQYYV